MRTRLFLILLVIAGVTISASGELADRYVARGFANRDAMLSAFFALSPEQQPTVIIQALRETDDCAWSDPWLMVYRGQPEEASGSRYEVTTLIPFDSWMSDLLVAQARGRARAFATSDPHRPAVVVRWTGPYCVALP